MDNQEIAERLNKIENLVDKLRTDLLNEDREFFKNYNTKRNNKYRPNEKMEHKEVVVTEEEENRIKGLIIKYSLPNEEEFIKSVTKIVSHNGISEETLEQTFSNIKRANEKQPKNDIKNYTYSCLHKIEKVY